MAERMAPRISLIYALVGVTWIGVSSAVFWTDTATGPLIAEVIKGSGFVVVTAALIYWLISKEEGKIIDKIRSLTTANSLINGITEHSSYMFAAWCCDKKLIAANPKFFDECSNIFGYRPEIGDSLIDICGSDHKKIDEFNKYIERMLRGESFTITHDISVGGVDRWYETSHSPLFVNGSIIGGFLITRDRTEQVITANAIRDSEQRLQAIIDHLADYIVIFAPDLTCRYYSAGFREVTGYSEEQALSMPLADCVHPDDITKLEAAITACIAAGQRVRGLEYRRRHIDGGWRNHSLNGGAIGARGRSAFPCRGPRHHRAKTGGGQAGPHRKAGNCRRVRRRTRTRAGPPRRRHPLDDRGRAGARQRNPRNRQLSPRTTVLTG